MQMKTYCPVLWHVGVSIRFICAMSGMALCVHVYYMTVWETNTSWDVWKKTTDRIRAICMPVEENELESTALGLFPILSAISQASWIHLWDGHVWTADIEFRLSWHAIELISAEKFEHRKIQRKIDNTQQAHTQTLCVSGSCSAHSQ